MVRSRSSASVNQGLVHIKHKNDFVLCGLGFDFVGNNQWLLLGDPAVEVIFKLNEWKDTVVKNKN